MRGNEGGDEGPVRGKVEEGSVLAGRGPGAWEGGGGLGAWEGGGGLGAGWRRARWRSRRQLEEGSVEESAQLVEELAVRRARGKVEESARGNRTKLIPPVGADSESAPTGGMNFVFGIHRWRGARCWLEGGSVLAGGGLGRRLEEGCV